eukprot:gb/GECG01013190.1/.p1 GENE.gb/GECG01013190.1/~~gb/GECG01013190.1/.p1  ORF type:complete len:1200 (+),score=70.13 gb/GECG01013190.1/:1-3600(+)
MCMSSLNREEFNHDEFVKWYARQDADRSGCGQCSHTEHSADQTMWEEFRSKQEAKARPGIHELLIKATVEWTVYCIITLYIIGNDPVTHPLLPALTVIRLLTLVAWIYSIVHTRPSNSNSAYTGVLTCLIGLIATLHFCEGVAADLVSKNSQLECWRYADKVACMVASRTFGPHQVAFMVVILATARLMVLRKSQFLLLLGGIAVTCSTLTIIAFGQLEGVTFQTPLKEADYYRAILPVVIFGFLNSYGLHVWEQENWEAFVQRKRLQLSCIRAEELLTLVMPRDVAHELMQGQVFPKHAEKATLGFLYISGYKEYLQSFSKTNMVEFVSRLHEVYSELDRVVLLHPNVYKVESVGDCYFVASNIPWSCESHAQAIFAFCADALSVCQILHDKYSKCMATLPEPWQLKIGLHSGPVTAGCCGKTRNFFRMFGDTVNVASRLASSASPNSLCLSEEFYKEIGNPPIGSTFQFGNALMRLSLSHVRKTHLKGKGEVDAYIARPLSYEPDNNIIPCQSTNQGDTPDPEDTTNVEPHPEQANNCEEVSRGQMGPHAQQPQDRHTPLELPVKLQAYRAFPFTGSDSTTAGSIFDRDGTKTTGKFQRTQRIVVDATKLLDIPFASALNVYRGMSDRQVRKKDLYYIKEVQHYYLKQFFNMFPIEVPMQFGYQRQPHWNLSYAPTATTDKRVSGKLEEEIGKHYMDNAYQDPVWDSMSHITRVLEFASLRFPKPELERLYQEQVAKSLYDVAYLTFGRFIFFLVMSLAVYSPGLVQQPLALVGSNVAVGLLILGSYEILKRFQSSKADTACFQNEAEQSETLLDAAGPRRTPVPVKTDSHLVDSPSLFTFLTSVKWERVTPMFYLGAKFSPWLTIFSFSVAVVLCLMDQIALSSLHAHYDEPDMCTSSFLPLQLMFSIFQIFPTSARRRALNACVAVVGFILVSIVTGMLRIPTFPLYLHGMYMLATIATNGIVESAFKELRYRQMMIRKLAAANAQRHAKDALTRLFPKTVIHQLERDEPVPFEPHVKDVVILWTDISGFTKLCSDLSAPEVKDILDSLYSALDHHVEQENLWKMDTIGDAYVVIGGLHVDDERSEIIDRLFRIAKKIQLTFEQFRKRSGYNIAVRIGIHAGPVVSGIIGALRPRFYIFGKTVLEAENLENSCKPGKVQVSQRIADLYWNSRYSLIKRSWEDRTTFWVERPPGVS